MSDEKTDFMNKTLYTLTLITALATPLIFLTGLFGMNFTDMKELVRALKGGISYRETGGVLYWK
jgi:Mg2+ and Co2+ transporter CorA